MRASELARAELGKERLPQVGAAGEASYAPEGLTFGYDPVITNGGTLAAQLAVRQSVYDGGVRALKSEQLDRERTRLLKERDRVARDLVYRVKHAFIEALRARGETALQRASVDALESYLGLVERLYAGGRVKNTDIYSTQIQLTRQRAQYDAAMVDYASAAYALGDAAGIPVDTTTVLLDSLEEFAGGTAAVAAAAEALQHNMELEAAALAVRASALGANIARHERYPRVTAAADAGYLGSVENLRLPPPDRYNALGYSVGVRVEVPLFDWGATDLRVQQRQLETENLRLQREDLRRSLTAGYRSAAAQLRHARGRLAGLRENVGRAQQNYLLVKAEYAGGTGAVLDVLTAQQFVVDTKRDEMETLAAIALAAVKLEQLTAH